MIILLIRASTIKQVEENCGLTTVDEIATAVYHMLGRIQEESSIN